MQVAAAHSLQRPTCRTGNFTRPLLLLPCAQLCPRETPSELLREMRLDCGKEGYARLPRGICLPVLPKQNCEHKNVRYRDALPERNKDFGLFRAPKTRFAASTTTPNRRQGNRQCDASQTCARTVERRTLPNISGHLTLNCTCNARSRLRVVVRPMSTEKVPS